MKKILSLIFPLLFLSLPSWATGKRVLFIGDSITDGAWGNNKKWNATSEERNQSDMNHIYGHGFMMLCASYYQGVYPEENHLFWNRGISGNTLKDLNGRWTKDVLDLKPDVVSILVGTNDVDMSLRDDKTIDLKSWEMEYRHLLDTTKQVLPDVRFVICTPFVAQVGKLKGNKDFGQREKIIQMLCGILEKIAQDYNAVLVPFDTLFTSLQSNLQDNSDTYWIWDGIHPTPAGHYRMAELWKEKAGKLITE